MIGVHNLSKVYSNGKGIFNLDLEIEQGEVFGFLGPNGAGKTTAIRVLLGFTNPTSGFCTIGGLDCRTEADKIQGILGYVPGEPAFFQGLTGTQFLKLIEGMRDGDYPQLKKNLIERFELEDRHEINKMSKGMKQKLSLVAAFMHDPQVLILDEPTSGLDPLMQRRFVELILEEKRRGKTILMSSHQFDEVERTCTRAAIIKEGKIVATEDVGFLKTSRRKSYLVSLGGSDDVEIIRSSGLDFVVSGHNLVEISVTGSHAEMFETLAKCNVTGMDAAGRTLEQTFIGYYGKEEENHDMGSIQG